MDAIPREPRIFVDDGRNGFTVVSPEDEVARGAPEEQRAVERLPLMSRCKQKVAGAFKKVARALNPVLGRGRREGE